MRVSATHAAVGVLAATSLAALGANVLPSPSRSAPTVPMVVGSSPKSTAPACAGGFERADWTGLPFPVRSARGPMLSAAIAPIPPLPISHSGGVPIALLTIPDTYGMTLAPEVVYFPTPQTPTTPGTTIPVYVIWYSNPGNPWTAGQKNLTLKWLANVGGSQWWTTLRDYPNKFGRTVDQMLLQVDGTVDNPETQGTNFDLGDDAAAVNANLVSAGGTLPVDPTGIYLVLPSDNDITFSVGGHHSYTGAGSLLAFISVVRGNWFQLTSPNGDPAYDDEMFALSHEVAEAMAFGWFSTGAVASQEIADLCNQVGTGQFVSNVFLAPNGSGANWNFVDTSVSYNFTLQDNWCREQGGICNQGCPPPSVLTPCVTNADCAWSNNCLTAGQHCAVQSCSDGIRNGFEADTDCGSTCGIGFHNCANGKHCFWALDCSSTHCTANVCVP